MLWKFVYCVTGVYQQCVLIIQWRDFTLTECVIVDLSTRNCLPWHQSVSPNNTPSRPSTIDPEQSCILPEVIPVSPTNSRSILYPTPKKTAVWTCNDPEERESCSIQITEIRQEGCNQEARSRIPGHRPLMICVSFLCVRVMLAIKWTSHNGTVTYKLNEPN